MVIGRTMRSPGTKAARIIDFQVAGGGPKLRGNMPAMQDDLSEAKRTIWTVGHSNHPPERFLDLLKQHRIAVVVDVRSSPFCRYATHFNKQVIQAALEADGLKYLFLGDLIGGRAEGERFYDEKGHVLYGEVARSARFREGIDRLLDGIQTFRVALLCGEEDPTNCHRRRLIGRVLRDQDVTVVHIRGDGRVQSEDELTAEEKFRKTKGQMSLFDMEDSDEWKSTQSVLPKSRPPNSLGPSDGPQSDD